VERESFTALTGNNAAQEPVSGPPTIRQTQPVGRCAVPCGAISDELSASCVRLRVAPPHAAPALAGGPGPNVILVPLAQAAQRHARQEAISVPAASDDNSLRAIATAMLPVFLAGM